ncbi:MAG: hypothetical protein HY539_03255 [Deltaproteobacteria bacterium]|nr:hypothetical protein [Deltaproteobacteria bacterium]
MTIDQAMLFSPRQLIDPSGRELEIQLETHVYSREDSARVLEVLKDKEVIGVEGVIGLSTLEKLGLKAMYYVSLPFFSLFARSWHGSENPTLIQTAVCSAIKKSAEQPRDVEKFRREVCSPLFGSNPPDLPSLKRIEGLESELSPLEHSALVFLEMRFLPLFFVDLAAVALFVLRPRQVITFFAQTVRQKICWLLRRPPTVVTPVQWPRFWTFAKHKVGDPCATAFNPFAWPRYFWERAGHSFSPMVRSTFDYLETGLFYYGVWNQIITSRNQKMARATNEMVLKNGFQNNMIVVGGLHSGIADVLVEQYSYRYKKVE